MKPTVEQQAVVDANGKIIKAVAFAGAGKTSTFVARAHAHVKRTLYLCFNKSVQVEAEKRFPKHVTCMTQHSMAYKAIITRRGYKGIAFTTGKLFLKPTAQRFRIDYYMVSLVHKTVDNFCNSADPELTQAHAEPDLIGRYTYDVTEIVTKYAREVWEIMISGKDQNFPMTHGGYLKLFQLSKPKLGYEVIMLDEAQDTNPVVHDIVLSQAAHGAQIILTGDPYQQIYAWRGAVDALGKVEAETLYMTQSFRFGPEVAGVANHLLNAFFNETRPVVGLAASGTIAGLTKHLEDGQTAPVVDEKMPEHYTFLARTNAFLFAEASRMAGKAKMFVPGSGQNGELPIFQSVLDVFALYQGRKFDIKGDYDLRNFDDYWQLMEFVKTGMADPEWNISVAMVEKYKEGVPAQIEKIRKSLVSRPEDAQVTLITAHRAKGMEWDNVVLGDDYAELFDDEGQLRQIGDDRKTQVKHDEINLLYVAATRAKKHLTVNAQLAQLLAFRNALVGKPLVSDAEGAAEAEIQAIEASHE